MNVFLGWVCLLIILLPSSSKQLEELLVLKQGHGIKAASPLYQLSFFLKIIPSLQDTADNEITPSLLDFSSLEHLVLCGDVDVGDGESTSSRACR